jgi:hypothetical protein
MALQQQREEADFAAQQQEQHENAQIRDALKASGGDLQAAVEAVRAINPIKAMDLEAHIAKARAAPSSENLVQVDENGTPVYRRESEAVGKPAYRARRLSIDPGAKPSGSPRIACPRRPVSHWWKWTKADTPCIGRGAKPLGSGPFAPRSVVGARRRRRGRNEPKPSGGNRTRYKRSRRGLRKAKRALMRAGIR